MRENCTEKINENGGKKSAKSLAQAGNCYIRRAPPTARPHTFGEFRKVSISNRVCEFTMNFPPAWTVLTIDEYETATPRSSGLRGGSSTTSG
jgi:hypothetical protein